MIGKCLMGLILISRNVSGGDVTNDKTLKKKQNIKWLKCHNVAYGVKLVKRQNLNKMSNCWRAEIKKKIE